jgi:threonine/homoserine/homoserine lactone efflux protein
MLEGITSGFILSLTLFPGAVWLVKVARCGGAAAALATGAAFFLSQSLWLVLAAPGLMMMYAQLSFMRGGIHLFAAFVLAYAGIKLFRCPRAAGLDPEEQLPAARELFLNAFRRSMGMPMRLPLAVALLVATGAFVNHPPEMGSVPAIAAGSVVGAALWWGELLFLAVLFGRRVPVPISLKSLNKIRPFSGVLFLCLAGIAVLIAP